MNFGIEPLNQLGGQFLTFAWPMLWQSSLLMVLVLAIDLLLAGKIRASVRHALWLVVLVKLLLPPSLALPTGAAWWLFPATPELKSALPKNYVVTVDDNASLATRNLTNDPSIPLPVPRLDRGAWVLLVSSAVSLGLLTWLLFRWLQVLRLVRGSRPAADLRLDEVWPAASLRRRVPVRLVEDRLSPAVCGLFFPVILLPRLLAEKLPADQLRAVLLHEAMHLRRLDIWTNFAQALLQILYWWHPLVWVANARIRRLREEAVDDAVMLALAGEAHIYAPTLLEVAKLALSRPLMSLGLVGIMESRSALRQRIERLVAFRAPRRAGLSLASLLAILAFSAVALPMGQGPVRDKNDAAPALSATSAAAVEERPARLAQVLFQAEIYRMPAGKLANFVSDLPFHAGNVSAGGWWSASPPQFPKLLQALKKSGLTPVQRPRIQTTTGMPAEFFLGNDFGGVEVDCRPVVKDQQVDLAVTTEIVDKPSGITNGFTADALLPNHGGMVFAVPNDTNHTAVFLTVEILTNGAPPNAQPNLKPNVKPASAGTAAVGIVNAFGSINSVAPTWTGPGRKAIADKLEHIRFSQISYDGVPLAEVLKDLNQRTIAADPEGKGIHFLLSDIPDHFNPSNGGPQATVGTANAAGSGGLSPLIDPNSGTPVTITATAGSAQPVIGRCVINIHNLTDVRLADVLDAIQHGSEEAAATSNSQYAIKYSVRDFAVVFTPVNRQEAQPLSNRTFKVDRDIFLAGLSRRTGLIMDEQSTNAASAIAGALRPLFAAAGVDWDSPPGKSLFYNDHLGYLFVKATAGDLDAVEKEVMLLSDARQLPLQLHIKARFIEVPAGTASRLPNVISLTGSPGGVLTRENVRAVLGSLRARQEVETLGEPEITVLSGRRCQMRSTQVQTMVTNITFQAVLTNQDGSITQNVLNPQATTMELGPLLDVVPKVLDDHYTVDLSMTASVSEFLGYAEVPTNVVGHSAMNTLTNAAGESFDVPRIWPTVQVRQASSHVNLYDDQTLVLVLDPSSAQAMAFSGPDEWRDSVVARQIEDAKKGRTEVLVLITVTLVDESGRRLHTDAEMPFAEHGVPPQPRVK